MRLEKAVLVILSYGAFFVLCILLAKNLSKVSKIIIKILFGDNDKDEI